MSEPHLIYIRGHCPACGASLFLGAGGYLTCQQLECPQPDAAHRILADRETEHIVQFDDEGFTIRHPLRERLDDALMRCDLHRHCASLPGPPGAPGRYRAVARRGDWEFQRIDAQETDRADA
ncbi:DUF6085 family protein [Streptomyces brasiliscabiei]|uniref:DUF6085 family protein n=1 Tax=Streptomyces brasiliscabiei TaxID=2736302 RepID=A0ABU8G9W3_9ACTN